MALIKCRQCGGERHLTIQCPFRGRDQRPKLWVSWVEECKEKAEGKRLHCNVPMPPGKTSEVHADTADEFWKDMKALNIMMGESANVVSSFRLSGAEKSIRPSLSSESSSTISMVQSTSSQAHHQEELLRH
jgi:hypothetical protein